MVIWPWPWIFKVKFWKCCISGMEGLIDMEGKGCESIGCYTHFVTSTFPSPMTLTLDFQGQILKKSYLRNGMADWHGRKGMWIDRMLYPLCDFQSPLHPWPWTWIFKVKFWKCCISVRADWRGTKGIWVDRMLDPCCDFQCSPLPWPWPWIFKVKFWKSRTSGMGWPIDMERKGCELIEC